MWHVTSSNEHIVVSVLGTTTSAIPAFPLPLSISQTYNVRHVPSTIAGDDAILQFTSYDAFNGHHSLFLSSAVDQMIFLDIDFDK